MKSLATILCLLLTIPALAQSVRLAWNPSTSDGITNYNVYCSTNGWPSTNAMVIQAGTNCSVTLLLCCSDLNLSAATYYSGDQATGNGSGSDTNNLIAITSFGSSVFLTGANTVNTVGVISHTLTLASGQYGVPGAPITMSGTLNAVDVWTGVWVTYK